MISIYNKRDSAVMFPPHVILGPGRNNVDPVKLDKLSPSQQQDFKDKQDLGLITVASPAESKTLVTQRQGVEPPASLRDRPVEVVEAFVETETDPKVLRRWKGSDERAEVKAAVDKRLKDLDAVGKRA